MENGLDSRHANQVETLLFQNFGTRQGTKAAVFILDTHTGDAIVL